MVCGEVSVQTLVCVRGREGERETDRRWMESERNEGVGKLGEEQRRRGEKGSLFGTSLNYKV